ncbi:MAG: tectonin domain-containing protein [Candidatus Hodarchaeales archaeon]|jgi:hypothetical protein
MTDFYKSLNTVNDNEQNKYGTMQNKFNTAINNANVAQNTMIDSYISANVSRKKCYDECPQGWSTDTSKWESNVEKDAAQTTAGSSDGLKDVIASCKAGCDLKWPGIVQNASGTEGVDAGKTIGRYTGTDGKEHDITQCTDLSKYAPKVKMGGLCDASDECESNVCVNWGSRCDDGNIINTALDFLTNTGHCGLGMTRIDGGNYSWGSTWNSMCKSNIDQLGMTKWPGVTQYIKYQGVWVKLNPDWGYPNAPKIENQRTQDGKYIQDEQTALKACEAYGEYCLGFYTTGDGNFILQSAGGENPKQSWTQFSSELLSLNDTQEGFGGYSSDPITNKDQAENPETIAAWGEMYNIDKGTPGITEKKYNNPTFPIANMRAAMKKTCPKSWQKFNGNCAIINDDVRKSGNIGWDGSSFGCNLSGDDYATDCKDVPNKSYTCWHVGKVPKGQEACRTIKGSDIPSCFASGGRPRDVDCPVPAKMIIWIGRPGESYFATKNDLVPALQQLSTEFPGVRLTDKPEMDDIIAKNFAMCACGWYRTDVFSGTTWKTGFDLLPLTNGYPSNTKSAGGCGSGAQAMIGCPMVPNSWNKGKGGMYVTISATQEFVMGKLQGLGFTGRIVESHQQLIEKPPPPKKQIWSTGSNRYNSSGWLIYQSPKDKTSNRGTNWNRIPGELNQMSTGQKEVYGVNSYNHIYAHAKNPGEKNADGGKGWRRIPGGLKNISASNKDYVFGVNRSDQIYQCKKPCKGGWQMMEGELKQISGGQKYVYGVNRNDSIYRARLPITNLRNPQWYKIPGGLKWINAGNKDYIYGTNRNNDIYVCQKPCTGGWKQISGGLEAIEADKDTVYGTAGSTIYSKPMDGMKAAYDWSRWTIGGGSTNVSPEPFVGGMVREGYAPLEGDMITACKDSGTQGGKDVPGLQPTGDFLVKNRVKEKETIAQLQSMQKQVNQSIKKMQADNLQVNSIYKNQSLKLLKQLASYENTKHKLLKSGDELDTLNALKQDSLLKKNSVDMSYYLWLTLAISVLGFTITKIK